MTNINNPSWSASACTDAIGGAMTISLGKATTKFSCWSKTLLKTPQSAALQRINLTLLSFLSLKRMALDRAAESMSQQAETVRGWSTELTDDTTHKAVCLIACPELYSGELYVSWPKIVHIRLSRQVDPLSGGTYIRKTRSQLVYDRTSGHFALPLASYIRKVVDRLVQHQVASSELNIRRIVH